VSASRFPDFFIVGHMKSGTTAMYTTLKRHPQIFMPSVKEPRFFAPELLLAERFTRAAQNEEVRAPHRHSLEAYLELFSPAAPGQIVGEASPVYLRSENAAGRIAEVQPQARIIAILRDPASFLASLHLQSVHSGIEVEPDFGKALALEADRREGRNVPRNCVAPATLLYSEHVRYVEQLERFTSLFGRERMLVLIYDDYRADNDATIKEVLRFLDVDDSVALETVETERQAPVRSMRLLRMRHALWAARHGRPRATRTAKLANALLPESLTGAAGKRAIRRVTVDEDRRPPEHVMADLRRRFKPEVSALSEYLGRDLAKQWGYEDVG
jgi:hypothetical protein